jgi:multidrug efflux pump subunit AcrB
LAARTRFNPIILTTLTTVAGIMPLIFVDTFWAGLSFTVIFGLLVASFLTLFITPIIYYQIEKEKVLTFVPPVVILVVLGALAAIAQLVL